MRVNRQEVQRVALLARLDLNEAETDELAAHFDKVLAYMDKLNELDTDGVEPLAHAVEMETPLRDDRVTGQANADALLQNAPQRQADFLKVPKIIE